jgi:hypothetical protein
LHHPRSASLAALALAPLAIALASCGSHTGAKAVEAAESTPPSTTAPATTAAPIVATWPLTGLPVTDPAAAAHPAVVVKMDNSPDARPQTAINQADEVFELRVEGITRYALVFHSTGLARPLMAWSGGNPTVSGQVHGAEAMGLLIDASKGANPPEYWRDNARQAPHNLYTSVPMLLAKFGQGAPNPPQAILPYAVLGTPLPATAGDAPGVLIDFGNHVQAQYVWDAERNGWDRFQIDQRHGLADSATLDAAGVQVAPTNVVILSIDYGTSEADSRSPQAMTVGAGEGFILTQGKVIAIKWARSINTAAFTFTTPDGKPVGLTPGRTWVALPQAGAAVLPLDRPTADGLLAVRR